MTSNLKLSIEDDAYKSTASLKWMIIQYQPLSTCTYDLLRIMIERVNSHYNDKVKMHGKDKLKDMIQRSIQTAADSWTSIAKDTYTAVIAHWMQEK